MKILFVSLHYAPELTGNAPYVSSLAEALSARGHEVSVITTHPHYPEWQRHDGYRGWTHRARTAGGVAVTRLAHYIPRKPTGIRRILAETSFGMRAIATRWPAADVVVLVSPGLIASTIARPRALRHAPTAVWVQDIYSLGMKETAQGGGALGGIMAKIEATTLGAPARIMAIHQRFKDYLTTNLGVREQDVEVIRNWTHLEPDTAPFDRAATRASFGWRDDEMVVLHAGNQGVKQGLQNVVNAAALADRVGRDVRFVLLGHGNQHDELRAAAAGITRVQFIEPLPDGPYQAAMKAADVLLVNERSGVAEMSVPSKLTSYFSTGVPVLGATDDGSVTAGEILNSRAGIRVDADDPEALIDGVEFVRALPDRGRELGSAGPDYVQSVLSMDAAVAHAEQWFESLSGARMRADAES